MIKYISLLFLLTSCSIKGTMQGLFSYYNKYNAETPGLFCKLDTTISVCDIARTNLPKVYITNGVSLKKCIQQDRDAVFYIWGLKCSSKYCYSPEFIQDKFKMKQVDVFIKAEYYDSDLMNFNYNTQHPIFGIDTKYYRSDLTSKYLSRFIFDLTSRKQIYQRIIYFRKGVYYNSYDDIDAIPSVFL